MTHRRRLLAHLFHDIREHDRFRALQIKRGVDEPRILESAQGRAADLQHGVFNLVRPRHVLFASDRLHRKRLRRPLRVKRHVRLQRHVHRKRPILRRQPHVGVRKRLAERPAVNLMLDRRAPDDDVFHGAVSFLQLLHHPHQLLRRRHRVVHPQSPPLQSRHRHSHVDEHVEQSLQLIERPHLPRHRLRERRRFAPVRRERQRPPVRVPPLGRDRFRRRREVRLLQSPRRARRRARRVRRRRRRRHHRRARRAQQRLATRLRAARLARRRSFAVVRRRPRDAVATSPSRGR